MMQNFAFGLLNMDMMIILHIKIIRSPIKYFLFINYPNKFRFI